jgi:hypothetical protein
MQISAQKKDGSNKVTVEFPIGANLQELVAQFGEAVVYSNAVDSIVIGVQALVRRHAAGTEKTPGKSQEEIQKIVSAYKPGVGAARATPVEKLATQVGKMSAEEKKALLKMLKEGAAAA